MIRFLPINVSCLGISHDFPHLGAYRESESGGLLPTSPCVVVTYSISMTIKIPQTSLVVALEIINYGCTTTPVAV